MGVEAFGALPPSPLCWRPLTAQHWVTDPRRPLSKGGRVPAKPGSACALEVHRSLKFRRPPARRTLRDARRFGQSHPKQAGTPVIGEWSSPPRQWLHSGALLHVPSEHTANNRVFSLGGSAESNLPALSFRHRVRR